MGIRIMAKAVEATMVGNWVQCSSGHRAQVVIGRKPECDMVLNDPSVEAHHACMEKSEEAWSIRALGSGDVYLNGVAIAKGSNTPVSTGDDLRIGIFALAFWPERMESESEGYSVEELADCIQWESSLVVLNGPSRGKTVALDKGAALTIGRGRGCELVLDDKRVSRKHARVENRSGTFWIEDLGSSNGLVMKGLKVSGRRPLLPGDVVSLGRYKLELRLAAQTADRTGWARVLNFPLEQKSTGLSMLGLLCLVLSLAACVAALMI